MNMHATALHARFLPSDTRRMRSARAKLERQIEALINMLDEMEVDPDLEPELGSIGSNIGQFVGQENWAGGGAHDREQDAGDEGEVDEDREWSLGEPENAGGSQIHWGLGTNAFTADRELDRSDDEPSLGWTGIATGYDPKRESSADATHRSHDQEEDDAREVDDTGIGDEDGLAEQWPRVADAAL